MAQMGKKFENFSSLEIAIQQYQKEENVQLFRRSSRTIEKAQITFLVLYLKSLQDETVLWSTKNLR